MPDETPPTMTFDQAIQHIIDMNTAALRRLDAATNEIRRNDEANLERIAERDNLAGKRHAEAINSIANAAANAAADSAKRDKATTEAIMQLLSGITALSAKVDDILAQLDPDQETRRAHIAGGGSVVFKGPKHKKTDTDASISGTEPKVFFLHGKDCPEWVGGLVTMIEKISGDLLDLKTGLMVVDNKLPGPGYVAADAAPLEEIHGDVIPEKIQYLCCRVENMAASVEQMALKWGRIDGPRDPELASHMIQLVGAIKEQRGDRNEIMNGLESLKVAIEAKGYFGSVEASKERNELKGKILSLTDEILSRTAADDDMRAEIARLSGYVERVRESDPPGPIEYKQAGPDPEGAMR